MLIKHITTSQYVRSAEFADTATIVNEVKQHGFYSEFCINLNQEMNDHDALISNIEHIAARVGLRVTFNKEVTICIFEDR